MKTATSMQSKAAALLVVLLISAPVLFSADRGVLPRSALPGVRPLDQIEHHEMPWVDVEKLRAEDSERERSGRPVAPRFAKNVGVAFTPNSSGTWEILADGSRLWRLHISSPGALSLSLGLERFELPGGAAFWVHAPDGSGVQGPYFRKNRNSLGGLWTAVVLGDELVAELHLPKGAEADLRIASVNHGYRFFGERQSSLSAKRGSCNINVVCPQGNPWRDQIRSVARYSVSSGGSSYLCTGQLVNNTAEDLTPYFLTAQHCIEEESWAPTLVAYWNYQSPECDDLRGGNLSQNQSGSTQVASSPFQVGSDLALLLLDDEPEASFNVYYSGWDARDQLPNSTTSIHHPSGDEKSITLDYDPPTVTSLGGGSSPGSGRYLRIDDWDEAVTEAGSSGACLFDDATKRCVGTLSGGYAACVYQERPDQPPLGPDEPDWYGRFYSQWTGEGTPETRLSDWLDPLGSDTLFLDGKNGDGVGTQETWLIPAAASLPGQPPTDWKTQIGVANPSSESRTASVYSVSSGQEWPGELLSGPHTIAANGSLYLDDPMFAKTPFSGLMYVVVDGTGTSTFCRTYTPGPDGGTYGQGQPGILLSAASTETELVLPLIHSEPNVFRTNVGFAQTSTGAFQVRVEVYSSDGSLLGQKDYSQSAAWRQVNDIFANMGIGSSVVEGGWIRVTLISGSPSYWTTYATVIDDTTDDPIYVFPVAP
jgi:hypothetical protein